MSDLTVITNNVPRHTIDACDLTPQERSEFDYLAWDAIDRGEESATFFRFKGTLYDLGEFLRTENPALSGWDGISTDTFFSATVIRLVDNGESVVVARVFLLTLRLAGRLSMGRPAFGALEAGRFAGELWDAQTPPRRVALRSLSFGLRAMLRRPPSMRPESGRPPPELPQSR